MIRSHCNEINQRFPSVENQIRKCLDSIDQYHSSNLGFQNDERDGKVIISSLFVPVEEGDARLYEGYLLSRTCHS
jgi:hypothetical protein